MVAMFSATFFFSLVALLLRERRIVRVASRPISETIEIVALWVRIDVLLWKATLLSGSFQLEEGGGVQPRV